MLLNSYPLTRRGVAPESPMGRRTSRAPTRWPCRRGSP